jgi:hypothetical protein
VLPPAVVADLHAVLLAVLMAMRAVVMVMHHVAVVAGLY